MNMAMVLILIGLMAAIMGLLLWLILLITSEQKAPATERKLIEAISTVKGTPMAWEQLIQNQMELRRHCLWRVTVMLATRPNQTPYYGTIRVWAERQSEALVIAQSILREATGLASDVGGAVREV